MKRFFDKAIKGNFKADPPPSLPSISNHKPQATGSTNTSNSTHVNGSAVNVIPNPRGLQPKDVVPAVPQPSPHAHLALLATKEGLLIRPHPGDGNATQEPDSYVRVRWGKGGAVEELHPEENEVLDWSESVVNYGIVGILELFACRFCPLSTVATGRLMYLRDRLVSTGDHRANGGRKRCVHSRSSARWMR